jgi:hypothetical protein
MNLLVEWPYSKQRMMKGDLRKTSGHSCEILADDN